MGTASNNDNGNFNYDYDDMDGLGGGMDMLEDGGAGADIESKLLGEH